MGNIFIETLEMIILDYLFILDEIWQGHTEGLHITLVLFYIDEIWSNGLLRIRQPIGWITFSLHPKNSNFRYYYSVGNIFEHLMRKEYYYESIVVVGYGSKWRRPLAPADMVYHFIDWCFLVCQTVLGPWSAHGYMSVTASIILLKYYGLTFGLTSDPMHVWLDRVLVPGSACILIFSAQILRMRGRSLEINKVVCPAPPLCI